MIKSKNDYDVVIVGGGLAGLTLAVLLGQNDITVGVIERTPLTTQSTRAFDVRTTAISAGSAAILTRAGIWERVADKSCPIEKIDILDGPHLHGTWPVLLNFDTDQTDGPFGYIVDNVDLRTAQAQVVANTKNITVIAPTTVVDMVVTDMHATLTLNTGATVKTSLVIGADGRGSVVRDLAGIRTRGWPYPHTAVVSTITHTGAHDNIAIEHFLAVGPFAVLPFTHDDLGRPRSAVVWSEHIPAARRIMAMDDDMFARAVAVRLPDRYGDVVRVGARAAYPLSLQHAVDYVAPRVALVADAAHGMHPIAGQGLNLGLRDVHVLADLIVQKIIPPYKGGAGGGQTRASSLRSTSSSPRRRGSGIDSFPDPHLRGDDVIIDLGTPDILDAYARARKPDILAFMAGTDALTGLFGSRAPLIRPLRKIGMRIINHLPPVKDFFIRMAKGA